MNSVEIDLQRDGDTARATIRGEFTEHVDVSAIRAVQERAVVFDLAGVEHISSCGVREWMRLVAALEANGRSIALERCSVSFVAQMNMISNFCGAAEVRSFHAPYLCTRCASEYVERYEVPAQGAPTLRPTSTCPSCGGESEFDDLLEVYLRFLR